MFEISKTYDEMYPFACIQAERIMKDYENRYKVKSCSRSYFIQIANFIQNGMDQKKLNEKLRKDFRELVWNNACWTIHTAEDMKIHPEKYKPVCIGGDAENVENNKCVIISFEDLKNKKGV